MTAYDGYITQIIRIINPLARQLKKVPIFMFHGANLDTSSYLMASSIQHHPEPCPRTASDGPITSSNRSLAFTLSNDCRDVYLIGQRASNFDNMGHTKNALGVNSFPGGPERPRNISDSELRAARARAPFYYQYGQDDVIAFEIKNQLDTAIRVSGATNFSIYSFSLSTPTTLAFLAEYPEYARNVSVYYQMGPAIAASHFTLFDTVYFESVCASAPTQGIGFFPSYVLQNPYAPVLRDTVLALSESMTVRYSLIKEIIVQVFGPSFQYQSDLELNVLARTFQPVSFKTVQQYCQNSISRTFTKFDYGLVGNQLVYGQSTPPAYNVSYIDVQNHFIVYGTNDGLASPETALRLRANVRSQKGQAQLIVAQNYDHYDLVAGVDLNITVNIPVRDSLNQYAA